MLMTSFAASSILIALRMCRHVHTTSATRRQSPTAPAPPAMATRLSSRMPEGALSAGAVVGAVLTNEVGLKVAGKVSRTSEMTTFPYSGLRTFAANKTRRPFDVVRVLFKCDLFNAGLDSADRLGSVRCTTTTTTTSTSISTSTTTRSTGTSTTTSTTVQLLGIGAAHRRTGGRETAGGPSYMNIRCWLFNNNNGQERRLYAGHLMGRVHKLVSSGCVASDFRASQPLFTHCCSNIVD